MSLSTSTLTVHVVTGRDQGYLQSNFETAGGNISIGQRVVDYIQRVISGNENAYNDLITVNPPQLQISIKGLATQALGTVTFSAIPSANDQFIINGLTFTCVASGAGQHQWNVGADATASAASLALSIATDDRALINTQVTATSHLGVTTIASLNYGVYGNSVTIAKGTDAGSVMSVSGARLTGGAVDPGAQILSF